MDDNDFVIMDALFAEVKRLNADLQEEDTEVKPDSKCREDDGCPTENAVLRREWRKLTEQLAAATAERDAAVDRLAAYEDLGPVEELAALKEQAKWIPVSERLPEVKNAFEGSTEVLVAVKYKDDLRDEPRTICSGFYFQGDEWWTYTEHACGIVGDEPGHGGDTVTHWMPLPEAPKEADHADS